MAPIIDAWLIVVVAIAARLNREQSKALEYLLAENRVLKEHLRGRGGRIRFADGQRSLLATKAKALGRATACPDQLSNGIEHHLELLVVPAFELLQLCA